MSNNLLYLAFLISVLLFSPPSSVGLSITTGHRPKTGMTHYIRGASVVQKGFPIRMTVPLLQRWSMTASPKSPKDDDLILPKNDAKSYSSFSSNLFESALSRAGRTLSKKSYSDIVGGDNNMTETVPNLKNLIDITVTRSGEILEKTADAIETFEVDEDLKKQHPEEDAKSYSSFSNDLLESALNRAGRTLSTKSYSDTVGGDNNMIENVPNLKNLMESTVTRAGETLEKTADAIEPLEVDEYLKKQKPIDRRKYLAQPAVTATALAHTLWSSALLSHDTAIDATCGNGKDSSVIADILFSSSSSSSSSPSSQTDIEPELICVDVQPRAIGNTAELLLGQIGLEKFQKYVRVLRMSHCPLPEPRDYRSVGLVCYNLGYLPGAEKEIKTSMMSTIESMADAASLLRAGGLLSVMMYPATDAQEAEAVEAFMEGLAMFSSRKEGGWEKFVAGVQDEEVRNVVREALGRISEEKKKWRVFLHKPLGRELSPVLVTAMRIK